MSESFAGKGLNGLANVGNTCYVNTTVQCLGHCISFLRHALERKYDEEDPKGTLLYELREILQELWVHDNGVIPNRFLKYLSFYLKGFELFEQNDISEFYTLLVDKLNYSVSKQIDTESALSGIKYGDAPIDKLRKKLDRAWLQSTGKEFSELIGFFYGQSIIQIVCGNCEKIHHNYEPFSMLLLPTGNEPSSLEDCISKFAGEEHVNDEEHKLKNELWKCDGCNECHESLKTMKYWRLPKVLVVGLKRFTSDLKKINTHIDVPETLDLSKYVLGPTHKKYELKSMACHSGNFHRGHYFAVCKNPNGKWYRIDDTSVSEIQGTYQTPTSAYMLFYEAKV